MKNSKPLPKADLAKETGGWLKRFHTKSNMLVLIVIALLLGQVPYLKNLLGWQMTFFHEISHGLAALATGGSIVRIELNFSGAGLCVTKGGLRWITSFAGYAGAAFWGVLIYLSAGFFSKKHSHILAGLLAALLAWSGILYARDLETWAIISLMALLYAAVLKFRETLSLSVFLKLAGLYILLDALKAPVALFRHQAVNDATNLASQTGFPALFWIIAWLIIVAASLVLIWKLEKK